MSTAFPRLTLRAHEDDGHLGGGAEVRHLGVEAVDGVEAGLVLQRKHEDHRVHPCRELGGRGLVASAW